MESKGGVVWGIFLLIIFFTIISSITIYHLIQSSERFIDNQDNSITDTQTNLIWMKCDYGLAGKDCNSPNYCGFDGTLQDSWQSAVKNSPTCDSEKNPLSVGKEADCTAISDSTGVYNYEDNSATAICANGVLCKDGAFIVVNWREDNKNHPNEYPSFIEPLQKVYAQAPISAKERACENHGGISKANWRVPTIDELIMLYTENKEGLDKRFFPNSKRIFQSSTKASETKPFPVKTINFNTNSQGTCSTSYPVKCVSGNYKNQSAIKISEDKLKPEEIFCNVKIPLKLYVKYTFDDPNWGWRNSIAPFEGGEGEGEAWIKIEEERVYVKIEETLKSDTIQQYSIQNSKLKQEEHATFFKGSNGNSCYTGKEDMSNWEFTRLWRIFHNVETYMTPLSWTEVNSESNTKHNIKCYDLIDEITTLEICTSKEYCLPIYVKNNIFNNETGKTEISTQEILFISEEDFSDEIFNFVCNE